MAGIGEAASILAFVLLAADVSKKLYSSVESFKNSPREVRDLQTEIGSLTNLLEKISQQVRQAQPNDQRFRPLRTPLQCCQTICNDMQTEFDECTTHSRNGQASVRDWVKRQFRGKSFNETKQRLAAFKSTLQISFLFINLYGLG